MKLRSPNATFVVVVVWSMLFIFLWQIVFVADDQGTRTTSSKLWADWVVHLTFTRIFAEWPVHDWFDINPLYALEMIRYPMMANLTSGLLLRSGLSLESAMLVPSMVASVLMVAGLVLFYRVAGFSAGWAGVGTGIFLFNGGMGFIAWALGDAATPTHIPELGIIVQNFVTAEFIPQRSMLFGAFLFLLLVSAVVVVCKSPHPGSRRDHMIMASAGVGAAVLMLSHPHSWLTLVMVCAVLTAVYRRAWRVWLTLLISASIACGLVYALYYASGDGAGFLAWEPGGLVSFSGAGLLSYLLLNYGLFLPLVLVALIRTAIIKNPLFLAGAAIFILAHLVRFQPWIWDNTKILTWSYLLLSVAVVRYLAQLWDTSAIHRVLVGATVLMLCLSGAIEVARIAAPRATTYTLFSAEDLDIAKKFRAISSHRDRVLTTLPHNNWVHGVAARPVFKAYSGWLWSYGLDVSKGEQLARRMLNGDYDLIRDSGIRFVVIDRRRSAETVAADLVRKLELVLQSDRYRVYAVPG